MSKLKNYNDTIWLLLNRLKTGNIKGFIDSISYRLKHGVWYSQLWSLGDDTCEYVLQRIPEFYNTGIIPSFIRDEDMHEHGFYSNEHDYFKAEAYSECWNILLSKIEFYLRMNLASWLLRLAVFKSEEATLNYDLGATYFGRYLPYLSF